MLGELGEMTQLVSDWAMLGEIDQVEAKFFTRSQKIFTLELWLWKTLLFLSYHSPQRRGTTLLAHKILAWPLKGVPLRSWRRAFEALERKHQTKLNKLNRIPTTNHKGTGIKDSLLCLTWGWGEWGGTVRENSLKSIASVEAFKRKDP